jgi:ketosteroid isomerase-like protein
VGLTEEPLPATDAERIRRAYEVWNESGAAAVIEGFYAEDAVYREGPGWPGAGVFQGRDAILARMHALVELAGPLEVRLDRLVDAGDGRFVAFTEIVGEAAASDPPYTRSFCVVHRMRDGLIVEADYYLDPDEALRAVGLDQ